MPLLKIGQLLGASDELKAVAARTRTLRALEKLYAASVPPELAKASHVKNYRAGTLFIAADNSAVAAKLRHMAPSVLASLKTREPEITALRVDVQVSGRTRVRTTAIRKNPVSARALKEMEALSRRVADEDLSSALARLVRHQRKPGR